jgi:hypothetical protein
MTVCVMPQPPPPRVNITPTERAGGIHQIRGWVGHGVGMGVPVKRKKYVTYRGIKPCVYSSTVACQNVCSLRNPQRQIGRGGVPYLRR